MALLCLPLTTGCAPRQTTLHATVPQANAPVEGITVVGFGEAKGPPNIARANVGVEIRALTADAAMREVNTKIGDVISSLKQLGVVDTDLRTQGVSLHFEREEPPRPLLESAPSLGAAGKPAPRPGREAPTEPQAPPVAQQGHYRATNTLEVTIRDLAKVGEALGKASVAGANLMFGLEFDIEDRTQLEAQARQKAVQDARARAEGLAQLSGVRLGRVLSISETSSSQPGPQPMLMSRSEAMPVERGELTVTSAITMIYALSK